MSIDNGDPDATILVHAQLSKTAFTAFTGAVRHQLAASHASPPMKRFQAVEKEYKLKDIVVPLETVDDRCFLVRYKADFGTLFCSRSVPD